MDARQANAIRNRAIVLLRELYEQAANEGRDLKPHEKALDERLTLLMVNATEARDAKLRRCSGCVCPGHLP